MLRMQISKNLINALIIVSISSAVLIAGILYILNGKYIGNNSNSSETLLINERSLYLWQYDIPTGTWIRDYAPNGIDLLIVVSPQYRNDTDILNAIQLYQTAVSNDINWSSAVYLLEESENDPNIILGIVQTCYNLSGEKLKAVIFVGEDTHLHLAHEAYVTEDPNLLPIATLGESDVNSFNGTYRILPTMIFPNSDDSYLVKRERIISAFNKFSNRSYEHESNVIVLQYPIYGSPTEEELEQLFSFANITVFIDPDQSQVAEIYEDEYSIVALHGHGDPVSVAVNSQGLRTIYASNSHGIITPILFIEGCHVGGWISNNTTNGILDPPHFWLGNEFWGHTVLTDNNFRLVKAGTGNSILKHPEIIEKLGSGFTFAEAIIGSTFGPSYGGDGRFLSFYGDPTTFFSREDIFPPKINLSEKLLFQCDNITYCNITCEVIDIFGIDSVILNITSPSGLVLINSTMFRISGTDKYYYNTTFDLPGVYNCSIQARDRNGNSKVLYFLVVIASDDYYTTYKNTPLTIEAPGVLGNDNLGNNSSFVAHLLGSSNGGVILLDGDGSFYYNPQQNYTGTDTFLYTILKQELSQNTSYEMQVFSNIATVYIDVKSLEESPYVENVTIYALHSFTLDDLTGMYDFYDINGDPDRSEYDWLTNESGQWESLGINSTVLDHNLTNEGSWYMFKVVPFDGKNYGDPVYSEPIQIKPLSEYAGPYSGDFSENGDLTISEGGVLSIINSTIRVRSLTIEKNGSFIGLNTTVYITGKNDIGYAINIKEGSHIRNSGIVEITASESALLRVKPNVSSKLNLTINLSSENYSIQSKDNFYIDGNLTIKKGIFVANFGYPGGPISPTVTNKVKVLDGGTLDLRGTYTIFYSFQFGSLDIDYGGRLLTDESSSFLNFIYINSLDENGYAVNIKGELNQNGKERILIQSNADVHVDFSSSLSRDIYWLCVGNDSDSVKYKVIVDSLLHAKFVYVFKNRSLELNNYTKINVLNINTDSSLIIRSGSELLIINTTDLKGSIDIIDGSVINLKVNDTKFDLVDCFNVRITSLATLPPIPPHLQSINKYINLSNLADDSAICSMILYYNDSDLIDVDENTLSLYRWSNDSWHILQNTSINTEENKITANKVTEFGIIGIFGELSNNAPVANDDYYSIDEDTQLIIHEPGVLGNDSDADNDNLTAILVNSTIHGSLIFDSDGSFTYTPDEDYYGEDSFTYRAYDGKNYSEVAIVHIVVSPVNDIPIANFTYEPLQPLINNTIYFNSTSHDIDGTIVNWTWNLGDGTVKYGEKITHQYTIAGVYNVNLTVMDNEGGTGYCEKQITVLQAQQNNAPNKPTLVAPANNSMNISINPTLTVHVIDTDGDQMTVKFYGRRSGNGTWQLLATNTNVTNDTNTSITWNNLEYNTTYEWYAVANDSQLENTSDIWKFKTQETGNQPPTVEITKPRARYLYIRDKKLPFKLKADLTVVIGPINITVNANDPDGNITKVEFYIDGELKYNSTESYYYYWKEMALGKKVIKVKVYDDRGASNEVEIKILAFILEKK